MVLQSGRQMSEAKGKRLPRLRRYLLTWFGGCAIIMVLVYTQLLEYYMEMGIDLRTESLIRQTAADYFAAPDRGDELLARSNLAVYASLSQVPQEIQEAYSNRELPRGEAVRRFNFDFDDDDDFVPLDTGDLCGERNCELLYLYHYVTDADRSVYFLHGIVGSDRVYREFRLTERVAFGIGGIFFALFLVGSLLGIRIIDAPLQRLESWSASLDGKQARQPLPSLRFQELDTLANRLAFAFERMRESVDKEKSFLRHASHELRTPMAILSSNVELLDRLTERPDRTDEENAAFLRQYRALEDIKLLTDTLLWINRQSEQQPKRGHVDLHREISTIIEDHRYLVDTDEVNVSIDGDGELTDAPIAAVRIVLSNLLKNAFQYTRQGSITITVSANQVTIENVSSPGDAADCNEPDEQFGFGLGLELVLLMCDRFDWRCNTEQLDNGRATTIGF